MRRNLQQFTWVFLSTILFAACKKDATPAPTPEPQPPVPINELVEIQPPVLQPVIKKVNDVVGGYYSGLPVHYTETTKSYPLFIFLPGAGQFGNGALDLPLLLNDGIAQLLDEKKFPPNFKVNGKNFSFIVVIPQFSRYPNNPDIASLIDYAKRTYRVDSTRIYLSGLSNGGFVTCDFAAEYTSMLAAIVPIAGANGNIDEVNKCKKIATGNLAVWVFHNNNDPQINSSSSKEFVSLINSFSPSIPARITLFPASVHDAWTKATDPAYKEDNMNMYEWMLHYSR